MIVRFTLNRLLVNNMDHEHFMRLALDEAGQALQSNEFPVGCVIAANDTILTRGHRLNSNAADNVNEMDHAEIVALRQLLNDYPDTDHGSLTVYSTMEPCLMCYATLLLNGIRTIVYGYEDAMGGGTGLQLEQLAPLYRQMRVTIVPHILRQESLRLFKSFFTNPDNSYWQDSMLAEYTLAQPLKEPAR